MGTILNSIQHLSPWPFNRDDIPLFLRTQPRSFGTIKQASKLFLSLVDFVKAGNNLDHTATRQACALLQNIVPEFNQKYNAEQILFILVPIPDGSCSGFAESIVLLLTSSNKELVQATLPLLDRIVFVSSSSALFDFLETGFFNLLPLAFYEQEAHLCARSGMLCSNKLISLDTFHETYTKQFLRPIRPFLDFVCKNRRRINFDDNSPDFSAFLQTILKCSPFLEEMTQENFYFGLNYQNSPIPTRGKQIMAKLCEEGLSDEIELHFRTSDDTYDQPEVFLGMQLIALFGGNYSMWATDEDYAIIRNLAFWIEVDD
ncbi:hypothetical protein BLNAU_17724 [Blattamonas nauphoetae]|uniref:Uncharacterized protein n=1 Tax=Blattamonas nauphoetae TaxID=2049346 RepID=A0ABQ9X9G7_9EUKA|nr:hypothetical protein BLNAU_17724 [Blattamonas nauphoetae]